MTKKKDNTKYLKIGIPVGVVLLLIIVSLVFIMGSSTRVAFLNIEEGSVEVDTGKGWTTASDGMDLDLKDKVRTLDGSAVLILYESILVQMDPNTEIAIEDLSKKNVKLRQESGSTWNKFMSIAGIQNFEVETPTTVATVRGTSFWVDDNGVGVESGNVDVRFGDKKFNVKAGHKAIRERLEVLPFNERDRAKAIIKKQLIVKQLKNLRQQEIDKHPTTYKTVKSLRGWTDDDVKRYMDRLDRGEFDENEIRKRTILPAESVDKFAKITTEIKKQQSSLEKLKSMEPVEGSDGEDRVYSRAKDYPIANQEEANDDDTGSEIEIHENNMQQEDVHIQSNIIKNQQESENEYIDNTR